jgi:hypothetical protein
LRLKTLPHGASRDLFFFDGLWYMMAIRRSA